MEVDDMAKAYEQILRRPLQPTVFWIAADDFLKINPDWTMRDLENLGYVRGRDCLMITKDGVRPYTVGD